MSVKNCDRIIPPLHYPDCGMELDSCIINQKSLIKLPNWGRWMATHTTDRPSFIAQILHSGSQYSVLEMNAVTLT